MIKSKFSLFRRIYNVILAVSVVVAGACLIAACLTVYYGGEGYSPEIVKAAFAPVSIPVYACLVLTAAGFILAAADGEKAKNKPQKNYAFLLNAMKAKKDFENAEEGVKTKILAERKKRLIATLAAAVVFVICGAFFLAYALDSDHFHKSEINSSMIGAMQVMAPCLAFSLISGLACNIFTNKSLKCEFELYKQIPSLFIKEKDFTALNEENASEDSSNETKSCKKNNHDKKNAILNIVKIAILVIAAAILIYGALVGGTADVLTKAVNICTECIGLG